MNLGQMRTALDQLTGLGMDTSAQDAWINAAIQQISTEREWPWLDGTDSFSTVADTAEYALPSDWAGTRSVTSSYGATYPPVPIRTGDDWDDWRDDYDYGFAIEGTNLVLYPTPTSVFTIKHRYIKTETALSSDSDTPELPTEFHWAIIHLAAALTYDRLGQMPQAAAQRALYDNYYRNMLARLSRARGPRRVRVRPGSGI